MPSFSNRAHAATLASFSASCSLSLNLSFETSICFISRCCSLSISDFRLCTLLSASLFASSNCSLSSAKFNLTRKVAISSSKFSLLNRADELVLAEDECDDLLPFVLCEFLLRWLHVEHTDCLSVFIFFPS